MFFFFNDTATTEIYTLSLHDALPIWRGDAGERRPDYRQRDGRNRRLPQAGSDRVVEQHKLRRWPRSEEHTSELQSRQYLVCRLLLEKKKKRLYYSFRIRYPPLTYLYI